MNKEPSENASINFSLPETPTDTVFVRRILPVKWCL